MVLGGNAEQAGNFVGGELLHVSQQDRESLPVRELSEQVVDATGEAFRNDAVLDAVGPGFGRVHPPAEEIELFYIKIFVPRAGALLATTGRSRSVQQDAVQPSLE